ncbi:MAG: hypothetical protein JW969_07805 [Spirochaetales bacterium]|nr:hypothetical protein [Spirochaetales bacterium]
MKKVIIVVLLAIAVSTFAMYASKENPNSLNVKAHDTPVNAIPANNTHK